jgi:geranylgeranyl diphosphate synthase type II
VAILASYALIAEGYGGIHRNSHLNPSADAIACLEAATRCAGISGATNGQYLDLYPPDARLETIKKIIFQKTGTLFEICFVFGWIFGGGSSSRLTQVRKCAYHLGMAFQIGDDLLDDIQDAKSMNIASICGKEKATSLFEEEMALFTTCLKDLGLWTKPFQEVVEWLRSYAQKTTLNCNRNELSNRCAL